MKGDVTNNLLIQQNDYHSPTKKRAKCIKAKLEENFEFY